MSVWLRRIVYFLVFLLWLVVMAFPIVAAVLATQGQLQVGEQGSARYIRLFLVQESDNEGVGVEWTRPSAAQDCREGRIIYLMWEGTGENARYCTCIDGAGSVISSQPGRCPAT